MTEYLQLNLVAPLQSWGATSKAVIRATEHHPTKSGMIGLLSNAYGFTREETEKIQEKFSGIKIHARIDSAGKLLRDYGIVGYHNSQYKKQVNRHYLQDAKFTVLIEAEEELLKEIDLKIRNPENPIFLGRKSCVPSIPIYTRKNTPSIHTADNPEELFKTIPLLTQKSDLNWKQRKSPTLTLETVIESATATGEQIMDNPLSFSTKSRLYAPRNIKTGTIEVTNPFYIQKIEELTIDPMKAE